MIGIIGAMDVEVNGLIDLMTDIQVEEISCFKYYRGKLNGMLCVVCISGIGKVSSAICTQTMIMHYSPNLIINTGIAGGLDNKMRVGDFAIARNVVHHDMDLTAFGSSYGAIPDLEIINIPTSLNIVKMVLDLNRDNGDYKVFDGTIATGDQFISNFDKKNFIIKEFNAIACDMEGASIGQTCYMNKVEFAVIRAISDSASDNSHFDYLKFKELASKRSINMILNIIKYLARKHNSPVLKN